MPYNVPHFDTLTFVNNLNKTSIVYDEIFNRFSNNVSKQCSYPFYNIKKTGDNTYVIEMAVAGFSQSDIDITLDGNKLTITGKTTDDAEGGEFLFKGIANRAFTRTFALADKIEVQSAEIVNGMLKVALDKLAEVSTVKKIEVKSGSKKTKKELLVEEQE